MGCCLSILVLLFVLYKAYRYYYAVYKVTPDFSRSTVWITGASSGIGEHLAYKFVEYNAKAVILTARRVAELSRVEENIKKIRSDVIVKILPLDLSKPESLRTECEEFFAKNNVKVDILVNNAGISQRGTFEQLTHADNVYLYNVNVFSPVELARFVVETQFSFKGVIVNMNTVSSKIGLSCRTAYCSSKHALLVIFDGIRCKYAPTIQITNVLPGYVKTNLHKGALVGEGATFNEDDSKIQNGMEPEVLADKTLRAVYRGESEVLICDLKSRLVILLRNIFPELVFWALAKYKTTTKASKKED